MRRHTAAVVFDLGSDVVELLLLTTDDGHLGTKRSQFMGDATPDAASPSGDNHGLAGEQTRPVDGVELRHWTSFRAAKCEGHAQHWRLRGDRIDRTMPRGPPRGMLASRSKGRRC